jgi:hypothetical protein
MMAVTVEVNVSWQSQGHGVVKVNPPVDCTLYPSLVGRGVSVLFIVSSHMVDTKFHLFSIGDLGIVSRSISIINYAALVVVEFKKCDLTKFCERQQFLSLG